MIPRCLFSGWFCYRRAQNRIRYYVIKSSNTNEYDIVIKIIKIVMGSIPIGAASILVLPVYCYQAYHRSLRLWQDYESMTAF